MRLEKTLFIFDGFESSFSIKTEEKCQKASQFSEMKKENLRFVAFENLNANQKLIRIFLFPRWAELQNCINIFRYRNLSLSNMSREEKNITTAISFIACHYLIMHKRNNITCILSCALLDHVLNKCNRLSWTCVEKLCWKSYTDDNMKWQRMKKKRDHKTMCILQ